MEDFKKIIENIYKDYNPDKLSNIRGLLEKYKGREDELLTKLAEKYSFRLENYSLAVDQPSTFEKEPTDFHPMKPQVSEPPAGKKSKNRLIIIAVSAVLLITLVLLYTSGVFRSGSNPDYRVQSQTSINTNANPEVSPSNNSENVNKPAEKISESTINVVSVSANSYMSSNSKINFNPQNVSDHDLQTWWTPSPPHSDGYNSWIRIDFGVTRKVVAVDIHNGSHYPDYPKYGDLYLKNNRLFKARLEFSNGSTQIINLGEMDAVQRISFQMQNTSYITLIPLEWGKGSQWNDLCISEFTAIGE